MVNVNEYLPLAVVGVLLLYFGVKRYRKNERLKILTKVRALEQSGRYFDALMECLRVSLKEAASLILRAPPGTQALLYQTFLQHVDRERVHSVMLDVISEAQKNGETLQAVNGYLLLNMPDRAIEILLSDSKSRQYLPLVVRIIEERPHIYVDKIRTARKYAQHLMNMGKVRDAIELLQGVGDQDGVNLLLNEAHRQFEQQGDFYRLQEVSRILEEHPLVGILEQLELAEKNFKSGDLTKARIHFSTLLTKWQRVQALLLERDDLDRNQLQEIENRIDQLGMIFRLIDAGREMLRQGDKERARQLFRELLDNCDRNALPATVLAEIALAHEGDYPTESSYYYRLAATKAKTTRARNAFIALAQQQDVIVGSSTQDSGDAPSREDQLAIQESETSPTAIASRVIKAEPEEDKSLAARYGDLQEVLEEDIRCSVCQIIIEDRTELVRCSTCNSPAHYGHLAEWLKIKGTCPICREKIELPPPSSW